MKRQAKEILHNAGFSDWMNSLKDVTQGKPSVRKEQEPLLTKFKQQTKILSDMLTDAWQDIERLGLDLKYFKGAAGKSTLENAVGHMQTFSKILNETEYTTVHEKPGEEVK